MQIQLSSEERRQIMRARRRSPGWKRYRLQRAASLKQAREDEYPKVKAMTRAPNPGRRKNKRAVKQSRSQRYAALKAQAQATASQRQYEDPYRRPFRTYR